MNKQPIIQTNNLRKTYGDFVAVSDLTLEIYQGEIFGLLGPNGAGKSTTISMIAGILKSDGGTLFFHGREVDANDRKARERVGVCPQNLVFWSKLTCIEQLTFIGEMYGMKKKEAKIRSEELLLRLGLDNKKNEKASNLSGGMQRRLNILLALVHDPEIIILDEPEAGLDPQSRVMVRDFILSLSKTKTVLLTTHNMDEAERVCDKVAIVDHGKLIAFGTIAELKNKYGKGEVIEIEYTGKFDQSKIKNSLKNINDIIMFHDDKIRISGNGISSRIPEYINILKLESVNIQEIKLRQDTLEDVFINLTGRKLRE